MFKRFALAAALFGFAILLPGYGTRPSEDRGSRRSSPSLFRSSFRPRARPRRIVLETLWYG